MNSNDKPSLEYLFHPNSIAIVGVSTDMGRSSISSGRVFLESLIDAGFTGKIYPVSRDQGKISGLTVYPSLNDIPDPVDYVISAVAAQYVPQLIIDCANKGVKAIHMFTAGFSEIADEEGRQLESQITILARQKGIRVIGPNCMGLYCPKIGLAFHPDFPRESGTVGFLSQSGGNSVYIIREGATRGIYFSKVISYGNACDLNESDFLEYFTHDPETKIIAAYIEGVKNGTRFLEIVKQVTMVKPVIIYKGGITESGTRAVVSHTGAIAGSDRIWNGLLKQVGAIQADNMEELVDILTLLRYTPPPKGKATAIIGIGGGESVQAADACCNAGLTVPLLPAEIRSGLKDLYASETGASFRNPVDMYFVRWDLAQKAIKVVANCDQIDLLIINLTMGFNPRYEVEVIKPFLELIISVGKEISKPTAIVLHPFGTAKFVHTALDAETALYNAGFPVFPSISQAAKAIVKYIQYCHRQ